ncbi:MAG: CDP-alcohol phosphatidyltransferase family protein [Kofleriaceae bacterium]
MWPAHIVTLLRIPLAVAVAVAYGRPAVVVALIAAAAVSDAVDGNLARWLQRRGKREPDIGGWLDPLADKIFVAVVLAAIAIHTRSVAIVALIGARELVLVPLLAIYLATRRLRPALHADWLGKLATIAQFVALTIAVAAPARVWPAAIATAALGLTAAVHYAVAAARAPA